MGTQFLSSEEYDERAHRHYDEGNYESALETLKEGLRLYPHSVDLYVGLGYTRLAREEFAWARQAFQHGLVLDPEHEDAMVGLGEVLLRLGRREEALGLFERVRLREGGEELELVLSMGRALYREGMFTEARVVFERGVARHTESADLWAALGYTLHRLDDDAGARRQLRRALQLEPSHNEARVYLGHLLYDRGDWAGALREFERVSVEEHWDALALWRVLELKRALGGLDPDAPELEPWQQRLEAVEGEPDAVDTLLAEVESAFAAGVAAEAEAGEGNSGPAHRVQLQDGVVLSGSWSEIVRQLRDVCGATGESIAQFMRRRAHEERARTGLVIPTEDPQAFVQAGARAGYWQIEY